MNTMSGVISVNRFTFDELEIPGGYYNVKDIAQSNGDNNIRNLCVSCHLKNSKIEWGSVNWLSPGSGCNAYHLNYNNEAIEQLNNYLNSKLKNMSHPDSIGKNLK